MMNFTFKKPEWIKEPESIDFKVINQPLEEVTNLVISQLKNENKNPKNFYFILKGLITTSFQTYKSIRKLIATEPKYPAQAHFLSRTLIDTLFTIIMLGENPVEHSREYELAGYRGMWEEYNRELEKYRNNQDWKKYLEEKKKCIESAAENFGVSDEEKENPNKIKFWPIPSTMLKSKVFCKDNQKFLEDVYYWRYGQSSEWSHLKWTGMALGVFSTDPECHWIPGKFESDAVYTSILFLLMIISEIEILCTYGLVQKLRYIWGILYHCFSESAEYYGLRYEKLLNDRKNI